MSRDAFDILGLPARFVLSRGEVQGAYLARVGRAHPDRAGGGDEAAAALNEARRVLEDPEARANVLLARLEGPGKEADRSLPEGFLMEMMEARERLEAAKGAEDERESAGLMKWAEGRRDEHLARVEAMFEEISGGDGRLEHGPEDRAVLGAIRKELNAWRYIERMLEQIDG